MYKKRVYLCLCFLIGACMPAISQKQVINNGWEFQRLTKTQQKGEIRNQGTDWSSQYNVEHVQAGIRELRVPEDTLNAEFDLLKKGAWEKVNIPHTPFIEPLTVLHQWKGICYYRKQLTISPGEAGKQIWIEFEGAMHLADVWINGKHIMQHAGGYTPFVVDATGVLKAGDGNEILVRLDNRNNPLIPPGKPLEKLDFCYYGGIYRNVNLIVKPAVHITHPVLAAHVASGGVFVTYPDISGNKAEIRIQTEVANKDAIAKKIRIRQDLFEWDKTKGKGKKVKTETRELNLPAGDTHELVQTMILDAPKLWSPDFPHLYVLATEILENGRVIDSEERRIGIRRIEFTREKGFVINGQPVRLVGSNRHMEYPYVGNAISDNAQYRDMYQIRNNGFNIVRLGHYPQTPSVLDACDELGLLVIEPIPGWQFFNKNEIFTQLTYRDVRDMIRRDRNHPSVIMWETTLNESWPPKEWKDGAVRTAHEEYPGDQCFTAGDMYGYYGFDICYNDWQEGFNRPNEGPKPGFIREYYDYEFGGHYSTTRVKRGDGQRALLQNAWNAQWSHNRYRAYYPWTTGDAVWSMYDYNRGCCDNICYSGVADLFRLPKFSLSFFRTQIPAGMNLPAGKMPHEVFIANYWNAASDTVMVYGNMEEVSLELNGKVLKRQKADHGPDTGYDKSPDGGNCKTLDHPPFTFTGIPWAEGILKAVGYQNGKKVAEYTVCTPQQPVKLDISYFESGRAASKNDLIIVNVRLLDVAGTLCPVNGIKVYLSVKGGAVVGPDAYDSEAGIASFLVQTGTEKTISLDAASEGMKKADKTIRL